MSKSFAQRIVNIERLLVTIVDLLRAASKAEETAPFASTNSVRDAIALVKLEALKLFRSEENVHTLFSMLDAIAQRHP